MLRAALDVKSSEELLTELGVSELALISAWRSTTSRTDSG